MNISSQKQTDNVLGIDERRAVIYTSLLRAAPEAAFFRERVLDHVILGGLLGSSEISPLKAGIIERNLYKDSRPFTLRIETVKTSLERLVKKGLAASFQERGKSVYYLTEQGEKELERALTEGKDIFAPVIERLLQNIDATIGFDKGAIIIRRFILVCFAQFGRQIAQGVLGQGNHEIQLSEYDEVDYAFQVAVAEHDLNSEATESLKYRCIAFLKSKHPDDESLKFHLTQSYYLLEILGANSSAFDPLAQQTFNGSVFYLDTNVIIAGLLSFHERASLFHEVVALAQRLGIHLKVTGTTLRETKDVISKRIDEINRFLKKVPDKIKDLVQDDFLEAYLTAHEQEPSLTPEIFFAPFTDLMQPLKEWGITLEDESAVGTNAENLNYAHISFVIQEEARAVRGREKRPNILQHDLSHFVLVMNQRKHNPKVWFLTNDRSLEKAAIRISKESTGHQKPVCFLTAGFLQSISPFVCSEIEERSLTDVFSALISAELVPTRGLFEITELLLISEMHDDVMETPKDDLIPALDYVKTKILEGRPYRLEEMPKVTSELKRYLSKSKDERHRALEEENTRLTTEIRKAISARTKIEQQYQEEQEERSRLQREIENLTAQSIRRDEEIDVLATQIKHIEESAGKKLNNLDTELKQENARRWRDRALIAMVPAILLWLLSEQLSNFILSSLQISLNLSIIMRIVNSLGLLLFVGPSFAWVQHELWTREKKTIVYGLILAIALATSQLLGSDTWSSIASIIELTVLLSSAIFLFFKSD